MYINLLSVCCLFKTDILFDILPIVPQVSAKTSAGEGPLSVISVDLKACVKPHHEPKGILTSNFTRVSSSVFFVMLFCEILSCFFFSMDRLRHTGFV